MVFMCNDDGSQANNCRRRQKFRLLSETCAWPRIFEPSLANIVQWWSLMGRDRRWNFLPEVNGSNLTIEIFFNRFRLIQIVQTRRKAGSGRFRFARIFSMWPHGRRGSMLRPCDFALLRLDSLHCCGEAGKINDLMTTGTDPEEGISAPTSM